ncbi:MAG: RNA polymerase sigma-70 factor [Carboxylicivirga sp.]|nr:RNA polymerase sigma-70 factor [Carboxylicivirga sp.]
MDKKSEKQIIEKLSRGDKIAFGMLFSTYHERLYLFAIHYLNNKETAEDIIQDVFGYVWEKHPELINVNNLSSWLYTITKNHCLKKIKHFKMIQRHSDELKKRQMDIVRGALENLDASPIIFEEIKKIMDATLESLPPQVRRIFEMSRFENKKNREISDQLGISIKTVEANMSKALKVLRRRLNPYLPFLLYLLY